MNCVLLPHIWDIELRFLTISIGLTPTNLALLVWAGAPKISKLDS